MSYTYDYPQIGVTVDIVLIAYDAEENGQKVLLIERKHEPFKGSWALPGGYVEIDETMNAAAHRELKEETRIEGVKLKRFDVFDAVNRNPRMRTITMAYTAFLPEMVTPTAGDDAANAEWFELDMLPPLAFDHERIIELALLEV